MLNEAEKLETERMWQQAIDIFIHHNIDCELSRFGDQYYITYLRVGDDDNIKRELNIHADGPKFRVRLYKWDFETNECEKIEDVMVGGASHSAVIAAHGLRNKECEYCVL